MESPASPGATDSAVPSDTDFGAPTTAFGFFQREPSDDVDDEFEGCIQKNTSLSLPSSLSLLLSPLSSTSTTTTTTTMTKTTAAIATMCLQSCKSTDRKMLINYNDHHSSEEELEVINSPKIVPLQSCRPATAPEKRKWSQISNSNSGKSYCNQIQQHKIGQINQQIVQNQQSNTIGTCSAPPSRTGRDPTGSSSSDEEVHFIFSLYINIYLKTKKKML